MVESARDGHEFCCTGVPGITDDALLSLISNLNGFRESLSIAGLLNPDGRRVYYTNRRQQVNIANEFPPVDHPA